MCSKLPQDDTDLCLIQSEPQMVPKLPCALGVKGVQLNIIHLTAV